MRATEALAVSAMLLAFVGASGVKAFTSKFYSFSSAWDSSWCSNLSSCGVKKNETHFFSSSAIVLGFLWFLQHFLGLLAACVVKAGDLLTAKPKFLRNPEDFNSSDQFCTFFRFFNLKILKISITQILQTEDP